MTTVSPIERKKIRTRFILIYAGSFVLALVVMNAFWQRFAARPVRQTESSAPAESDLYFIQLDTLLHGRMQRLDDLYTGYVRSRRNGSEEGSTALFSARADMGRTLDSIDLQASYLSDGPKKTAMTATAAMYRKAITDRDELMNGVLVLPKAGVSKSVDSANLVAIENLKLQLQQKDVEIATLRNIASTADASSATNTSTVNRLQALVTDREKLIASLQTEIATLRKTSAPKETTTNTAAVSRLQTQVTEKDRQIALLQTQLKQKDAALKAAASTQPVVQSRPSDGGEWQRKYAQLKSSYDKAVTNEKSLKNAYQTVADDNRRLLTQLQTMRKN